MARKHHHVVSEGYQRLFADGSSIVLVDKHTLIARRVGTKGAFAKKHFCSYIRDGTWSDEIEDEWSWRESATLPCARRLIAGGREPADRNTLKTLAAIHYVRSFGFEAILEGIMVNQRASLPKRFAAKQSARDAFMADYGRQPALGEIEQLVDEQWLHHFGGRTFLVREMAEGYNKTMAMLEPLHVQLVWPHRRGREFVFGDIPVVHYTDAGRLGAIPGDGRRPVALGNSDHIFFPLAPRLGALFTSRPFADAPLTHDQVEMLNRKSWALAMRFLGAHPATNVKRATGQWSINVVN